MRLSKQVHIGILALTLFMLPSATYSQTITLHQNDFESPNIPVFINCGSNLYGNQINTVYGSAQGTFAQINSVETVLINAPGYSDPAGGPGCLPVGGRSWTLIESLDR